MKYVPPLGGADGAPYVNHNPALGVTGSIPTAESFEHVHRELDHLIAYAGLTPTGADLQQVRKAIEAMTSLLNISQMRRLGWSVVDGGPMDDPPGTPALGRIYIVGDAPTGAFTGHEGQLAQCIGVGSPATYVFHTPVEGHLVRDNTISLGLVGAYKRRTGLDTAGNRWANADAATDRYGFTRLATLTESKDAARADIAVTPAALAEANASKTLAANVSANQVIPSNTFTAIIWGSVATTSEYVTMNTSTGQATFNRAGTYLIEFAAAYLAALTSSQLVIEVRKTLVNTSQFSKRPFDQAVTTQYSCSAVTAMSFAAGDKVDITLFVTGGVTLQNVSSVRNYINITRIGD